MTKLATKKREGRKALPVEPLMRRTVMLVNNSGKKVAFISRKSGVTSQTIRNWRTEKVRRPQISTINAVLKTLDYELEIVSTKGNRGPL
jgi:transposase-like protein